MDLRERGNCGSLPSHSRRPEKEGTLRFFVFLGTLRFFVFLVLVFFFRFLLALGTNSAPGADGS